MQQALNELTPAERTAIVHAPLGWLRHRGNRHGSEVQYDRRKKHKFFAQSKIAHRA